MNTKQTKRNPINEQPFGALPRIPVTTGGGVALTTVLFAAGGAQAQEPTPEKPATAATGGTLPEYVVDAENYDTLYQAERLQTPKYTQPLRDVPQTITIIPEALIEDQGATTLRDVLRNVPGISIQAGEGGVPAGDNLSIRGFNARTDIFIDGIRDFGGYGRDPFNFEQVEVAKGPASSNAGRGSTGGSLNLVSKSARMDDFVHSDVSAGSDQLKRTTLDLNQTIPGVEGAALRLNTMWHENDIPGRGEAANERFGIAASLGFGLGERTIGETPDATGKGTIPLTAPSDTRLWLNFFHFQEENQPDYGIPWVPATITDPRLRPHIDKPAPVPYDSYYGLVLRDFEDITTTMGTVRFEHDINESITFRNQFRVGSTERLSLITAPRFTGVGSEIRRSDWKDRDEENTILANQTDFQLSFDTGSLGHEAVFGFELTKETNERFRRTAPNGPSTDLFHPTPFDPINGGFDRTGARTDADAFSAAVYLFDTIEFTDWLEVTGGARWDHYELDYLSTSVGGSSEFLNRVDDLPSGRAAVVLKPAENGSVYFGYGTSFNPAGEGLSLSGDPGSTTSAEVDPEESRTLELGTKWNVLDDRLSLTAALFRTDKTNARTIDPTDPDAVVVLDGEQRVQGVELGVSGDITDWLHIFGGYTHLDSEILSSQNPTEIGNQLPHTPEDSFNLWTQIDLPGGFFVGGGPQFVDSRFNNSANLREAPSYTLWDAVAGYQVNENLTLRVNVRNLGDEDYIDRVGGGHFIPGEGRSVMFTASLKF
ncbi:MAG: TonB-dependent siderophore receptor [Verrucomicrobiae bacterium]|nr:TonB-dependent siderophore receptor [Verrucomicrobiae bacterium]